MAKVTVYYFTEYHIVSDEKVRSARPATLETFAKIENAIVLEETAKKSILLSEMAMDFIT